MRIGSSRQGHLENSGNLAPEAIMTYSLRLHFGGSNVNKGDLPGAVAYIAVKDAVIVKEFGDATGISHQCMGPKELAYEIQRLN
jgi:hypothetical protein